MFYNLSAGRLLQALAVSRGNQKDALAYVQGRGDWSERGSLVERIKMAGAFTTGSDEFTSSANDPVAEAFLDTLRSFSVPLRLDAMRRVPFLTNAYLNAGGITAVEAPEGSPLPVLKSDWTRQLLRPRLFGGIVVQTREFVEKVSDATAAALQMDLARSVAEAENLSFVRYDVPGSVFDGQASVTGSLADVSAIDGTLDDLLNAVPAADRPGAAWVMTTESARTIALARGSGGASAFPNITPQGGQLLGIPVLVTTAADDMIGLIAGSQLFYASDDGVELTASQSASLAMNEASDPEFTPLFQADSIGLKGVRRADWYARPGAAAYATLGS